MWWAGPHLSPRLVPALVILPTVPPAPGPRGRLPGDLTAQEKPSGGQMVYDVEPLGSRSCQGGECC